MFTIFRGFFLNVLVLKQINKKIYNSLKMYLLLFFFFCY